MDEDALTLAVVFAVWALLAAAYTFVPMFDMPDAARVWGAGAVVFLALALWVARCRRRASERPDTVPK